MTDAVEETAVCSTSDQPPSTRPTRQPSATVRGRATEPPDCPDAPGAGATRRDDRVVPREARTAASGSTPSSSAASAIRRSAWTGTGADRSAWWYATMLCPRSMNARSSSMSACTSTSIDAKRSNGRIAGARCRDRRRPPSSPLWRGVPRRSTPVVARCEQPWHSASGRRSAAVLRTSCFRPEARQTIRAVRPTARRQRPSTSSGRRGPDRAGEAAGRRSSADRGRRRACHRHCATRRGPGIRRPRAAAAAPRTMVQRASAGARASGSRRDHRRIGLARLSGLSGAQHRSAPPHHRHARRGA